jgi:class 3 adenylate cyclase/pSer/pThr/pTyr-binding forkhead associated (FHA) protein
MKDTSSNRLEELIRERARLDVELERCKEIVTVLFVDIVGSTRFYDEHGDVAGLVMVQKALDLLIPIVEDYEGTVIKTIGDAILARYCDVEQAVRSAIEMQCSLAERNRDRRPNDQIHVRVAINLGLALLKGNDVFGDVVNVTARIEGATDADEITISPSVYEKIQHLPDLPVKKKASGVDLKGKSGKLDLYNVVWKPGESAGPAPPRPSKEQLFIATGLHTGLADALGSGRAGVPASRPGVHPKPAASLDKTVLLSAKEVAEPPAVGLRFALARVGPDGSLGERFPLDQPGVVAGQKGEIPLTDDPLVAAKHARFTQLGEGVYVEDLGSPQGVYLWVREPYRLKDGDIFQIGRQRMRFVEHGEALPAVNNFSPDRTAILAAEPENPGPVLLRLNSKDEEMGRYELRNAETSFGRSKGTHTFPDDPYLSTIHAQIRVQQDKYVLEDLGSTNGTFARIRKRALAREGDTLKIGRQMLRVVTERPTDRRP